MKRKPHPASMARLVRRPCDIVIARVEFGPRDRFGQPVPSRGTILRRAIMYGAIAVRDPRSRPLYQAFATSARSAFEIAASDFLQPPTIDAIALGLFDGLAGDEIIITARDDVEVASVQVVIKDMTGEILASGAAENRTDDAWVYTATSDLPPGQPATIEVTAKDRPGNTVTKSVPWVPTAPASWLDCPQRTEGSLPSPTGHGPRFRVIT